MTLTYARSNNAHPGGPPNTAAEAAPTVAVEADRFARIGRTTFKIGSVTFIFIGALHTFVQATQMSAPEIRANLEAIGTPEGMTATAWELWAGLGFLMGFFSVALGLSNLAGLKGRTNNYPAAGVCAVNIVMLASITTIGALFLGPIQMIGGPIGIVMFGIPLIAGRQVGSEAR